MGFSEDFLGRSLGSLFMTGTYCVFTEAPSDLFKFPQPD